MVSFRYNTCSCRHFSEFLNFHSTGIQEDKPFQWKVHFSKKGLLEVVLLEGFYIFTSTSYLFSSIYLPPNKTTYKQNVKNSYEVMKKFYSTHKVIMLGDFNADQKSSEGSAFFVKALNDWYSGTDYFMQHLEFQQGNVQRLY